MSLLLVLLIIVIILGCTGGGYYGYRNGWWGGNTVEPPYVNQPFANGSATPYYPPNSSVNPAPPGGVSGTPAVGLATTPPRTNHRMFIIVAVVFAILVIGLLVALLGGFQP